MWGIIIFAVVAFLAYHFLKGYNSESKKVKESFKNQNSNYQEEEVPAVEPLDISFEESNKEEGKYLVVDTETTGLPTDRYFEYTNVEKFPRIIQLAWMLLDDEFKVINNDSFYINPGVSVPPEATRVNGITTAMIRKEGITPKEAYAKFLNDANRAKVLVAHNADFDVNMIKSELYRNGFGEPLKHYIYCTMFNTSQFVKYNNKRNLGKYPKLSELAGWLFYENTNLSFKGLHNAENDTAITAKCFIELHNRGYIEDYLFEPSILSGDMLKPDFKNVINLSFASDFTPLA